MTQTYKNHKALEWMRLNLCPECGERAEDHSSSREFWLRGGRCDLLPFGVTDRIDHQCDIDRGIVR